MHIRLIVLICLLSVFIGTTAQPWAGLHFTDAEIAIWRSRKDNGPYKDEWTAVLNRATAWRNAPEARWSGNTSNSCWGASGLSSPTNPGRKRDAGLRDGGFVHLLTGDTTYLNVIRTQLLNQANQAGTNFGNTTRWCPNEGNGAADREVAEWVRRLVYGYSYIRHSLSSTDKEALDNWFLKAARYFESSVHKGVTNRFPGRLSGNYTCSGWACPGRERGITHFGGNSVYDFHLVWENTMASCMATVSAVGALLNDAPLKNRANLWVQEFLKYGVFPGGWTADQRRWGGYSGGESPKAYIGYSYQGTLLGSVISIADHLARSGDLTAYKFSTSDGLYGTAGGPKTLLKVLRHFASQTNGTVIQYASTTGTTDPALIIDDTGTESRVEFVNLTPANIFYNDLAIITAYQKRLPANWSGIGCDMLSGEWCSYPRIRFMFGQMEGKVSPYSVDQQELAPPTNLRILSQNP
jgi:hypothetical protein